MATAFEHKYATVLVKTTDGGTDFQDAKMKIWKLALPRCGAALYVQLRDIQDSELSNETRAECGNARLRLVQSACICILSLHGCRKDKLQLTVTPRFYSQWLGHQMAQWRGMLQELGIDQGAL
eukprot:10256796-Lingulodinium_polyedra.AAC.1